MLKLLSLTLVAFTASIQRPAIALEPDYACYFTTSGNQVVDLSNSLCRPPSPVVQTAASVDSLFLAAYKQAAIAKHPNLRNTLLKQPPEINIKYARAVCHGLEVGLSAQQVQSLQTGQINKISKTPPDPNQSVIDLSVIQQLAPQYYCPQFK